MRRDLRVSGKPGSPRQSRNARRSAPSGDWRSDAVVETLSRHVQVEPPKGDVLVLADPDPRAARLLGDAGAGGGALQSERRSGEGLRAGLPSVVRWSRRVTSGATVSSWPPPGPWDTVALRLPRAKDELEMLVHAAASVLVAGGTFLVYGAKDEGIRSAPGRIEPVFGSVDTVAVKSRCRVLRARRPNAIPGLKGTLEAWRKTWRLEVGPGKEKASDTEATEADSSARFEREWVSYPGVFSHGRIDAGTRILLEVMDRPEDGARILDYGCGSGVIAGVLAARAEGLRLHLLDADAIALEAARKNVPGAHLMLGDSLDAVEESFDFIVSNPPYHRGKVEDRRVLQALVEDAPDHLDPDGALVMVVQRRFAVGDLMKESFRRVEVLGEDATYRVWRGEAPRT